MQVTKEADYAVRCVLHLASMHGSPVPVGEIERAQDVPRQFAAKILQKLARAGLVKSVRGVNGGFMLTRAPKDISLLDVYEASSGPLCLNICVANKKSCDRSGSCPVHPVWVELSAELRASMGEWDFERLLGRGKKKRGRAKATAK
jgi:Rrf2 family protein